MEDAGLLAERTEAPFAMVGAHAAGAYAAEGQRLLPDVPQRVVDRHATGQRLPQHPFTQRRDPLGRQMGNTGQFGTDENLLQGEDVYRRAEELLGEIRRRSAEQNRPEVERDYLRRLLDRF